MTMTKRPQARVYLDIDGVLADFVTGAQKELGLPVEEPSNWAFYEDAGMTKDQFDEWLEKLPEAFWANLEPFANAWRIVNQVEQADPNFNFLSHSTSFASDNGKVSFIRNYFGQQYVDRLVLVRDSADKAAFAGPGKLLIDDSPRNLESFKEHGGEVLRIYRRYNVGSFGWSIWPGEEHIIAEEIEERIGRISQPAPHFRPAPETEVEPEYETILGSPPAPCAPTLSVSEIPETDIPDHIPAILGTGMVVEIQEPGVYLVDAIAKSIMKVGD